MGAACIAEITPFKCALPKRSLANAIRRVRVKSTPLLSFILFVAGMLGCSWISFRFGQSLASVGFLYLVFVVFAAIYGGFWRATLLSFLSVTCLDYFFSELSFSFRAGIGPDRIGCLRANSSGHHSAFESRPAQDSRGTGREP